MSTQSASTVIDARGLIGRPGTSRSLSRDVTAPADLSDPLVRFTADVRVTGIIESVVDGLLVRASVAAPVAMACARCLTPVAGDLSGEAVELFADPSRTDDEVEPGYAVVDETIDLDTLVRDTLAEVRPLAPLCRPGCAGLCPTCGADRNVAPCDGHDDDRDDRWAALAALRLPDAADPAGTTADDPTPDTDRSRDGRPEA